MALASVPFSCDFSRTVASQLVAQAKACGCSLADVTVWVPSPRQGQALAAAFQALDDVFFLPRILPLHLPEDIPETLAMPLEAPATTVSPVVRQLVLTRLIRQRFTKVSYGQAFAQAGTLASLLDELSMNGLTAADLTEVVQGSLAAHWQENLSFLDIVLSAWPAWLTETHAQDAHVVQQDRLARLAAYYDTHPVHTPVWAVGFADTTPRGLAVLQAIHKLPLGCVVVPGFSAFASPDLWSDPQMPVHQLVQAVGGVDAQVEVWDAFPVSSGVVTQVALETPQQEAAAIALMMREAWEDHKTCALVSPDRSLARRVQAELARWDMRADDSAGQPVLETEWGQALQRLLRVVSTRLQPLALAEFLQHRAVQSVLGEEACLVFCNTMLRGVAPEPGLAGLRRRWQQLPRGSSESDVCDGLLNTLAEALQPLTQLGEAPIHAYIKGIEEALGLLTGLPVPADVQDLFRDVAAGSAVAGSVDARAVEDLFSALLAGVVERPVAGARRLFIWGPLEARLQQVDRVILGSLNEGTWPIPVAPDPWLNRTMRTQLGLPDLRIRWGLAAHDFYGLLQLPDVFLTRAQQADGQVLSPSRLWVRWENEVGKACVEASVQRGEVWRHWVEILLTEGAAAPVSQSVGLAPVEVRPTAWSATGVRGLMTCPYAFYLQRILNVAELDPFGQTPEARERGDLVHTWLQAFFVQVHELPPPFDAPVTKENKQAALQCLLDLAEAVCAPLQPMLQVVWLPRFRQLAPQLIDAFISMTAQGCVVQHLEHKAEASLGTHVLHARADRVDVASDGVWLIDYKTGAPPDAKDVAFGREPQLAVEGWLQQNGGYVADTPLAGLSVWHLSGGSVKPLDCKAYTVTDLHKIVPDWLAEVEEGLLRLIDFYADPAHGYAAVPSEKACRYCAYAGVCRKAEWANDEGDA